MKTPHLHTFSIVACDPSVPAWGVAVASKFLAAGAVVSWARAGAGAVATQAHANVPFGVQGLDLMAGGLGADGALARLIAGDEGRAHRQVGLVDAQGRAAAYTGEACMAWAGHRVGQGYACQGNILTGPETLDAMADAFERTPGALEQRLIAALDAGDRIGGDRRGKQSAGLLVVKPGGGYGGDNDRYLDLRVDDDPNPVGRLAELLALHALYFGESDPAALLPIDATLAAELQTLLVRRGFLDGPASGAWDASSVEAFWRFVSIENLEERWSPDAPDVLDPVVLAFIRERFPG
jgi:uncharacterized Ntn-hydrolase superfamily protein